MPQIAKALLNASEESLNDLINQHQEDALRTRVQIARRRNMRQEIHRNPLPKRCSGMSLMSVAAPGTDVADVMGKTWFRQLKVA